MIKEHIFTSTVTLLVVVLYIHTVHSTTIQINNGEDTTINYTAYLRGELVPSSYQKHPLEAYGCFYGLTYQNCTCFTPKMKPSLGCYGPKCFALDENPGQTYLKNYSCSITNENLIDCSQNESENLYMFTNCTSSESRVNASHAVNLVDYEFRFDSIELDRQHKVVKCPLIRDRSMFLHGYVLEVNVHVHKVRAEFDKYEWVVQVLACKVQRVMEYQSPLPLQSRFQQMVMITSQ